jgi:uncharacterized protein YkwD
MGNTGSRITGILTLVAISLLPACSGGGPGSNVSRGGTAPAPAACLNPEEASLMDQINSMRTAAGKAALPFDSRLIQAARQDASQFAANGVNAFEFGKKYGYGGTSFVGYADAGFQTAADFWAQAQQAAGTGLTDPLAKDSPFAPKHIGVGTLDQADGMHTFAFVLGSDPGPAANGSCSPG